MTTTVISVYQTIYHRGVGSLAGLGTVEVIDRVLGQAAPGAAVPGAAVPGAAVPGFGDVREQLADADAAAWGATSPRLLELCRVRIAMMLGCDAEATARTPGTGVADDVIAAVASWPTDARFDDIDRACLAFTEHYVIDVASVDDDTVAAVRAHLGDEGTQNFVGALLIVEQRIRLRLVWDRLLDAGSVITDRTEGN